MNLTGIKYAPTSKCTQATILIVDDVPENLQLLSTALAQEGYDVRNALNGAMAMMGIATEPPDLVLLDVSMPDMDGFEVCRKLKANADTAAIPVVFISALGEVLDKVKAFEVGGVDYVTKPFQIAEIIARVRHQIELRNLQNKLRKQNQQLEATLRQRDKAEAKVHQLNQMLEHRVRERTQQLRMAYQNLQQEMRKRQQAQARLFQMAMYDPLTGLANRSRLLKSLEQALQTVQCSPQSQAALLLLDCDRFKSINNTLGHGKGDQLLVEIANRITAIIPSNSLTARLGHDEFAILLTDLTSLDDIHPIVNTLQESLAVPILLGDYEVTINARIGIVAADPGYSKAEYWLRDGDLAMSQAKIQQPGDWCLFTPEMRQQALHRLILEAKLRQAIQQNRLQVYYQPIFTLEANPATNSIVGYEALVRWQPSSTSSFISPAEFIPLAEETGLISLLGAWILETACRQIHQWNQSRPPEQALFICVNFSVHQLNHNALIQQIDTLLQQTQIEPHWLKIEITESVLMQVSCAVLETLVQLRDRGVQISIDDFGTGYSSLAYLKQLPVDILKIDRTFVKDIEFEPKALQFLEAIFTLARALELDVVVEGIETEYQAQQLTRLGYSYGQGYWFASPVDNQAAEKLLTGELD
ncbi:MAG: EAL domain-containing protein [Cyanobacteria bacterium P01_F01_bin.86]